MSQPSGGASGSMVKPTMFFYWMVLFIVISAFNYGYGISELNALQGPFTCEGRGVGSGAGPEGTKKSSCLGLTESQFGIVTAMFTLGGFSSSLSSATLAERFHVGPRRCILLAAVLNAAGGVLISYAGGALSAGAGRFVMGLGAGISVVYVPMYLSDISPPALKGSIGVLNQLGIVIGIFVAQLSGTFLTSSSPGKEPSPTAWRWVPIISALVSVCQLVAGVLFALESPRWEEEENARNGGRKRAQRIRAKLYLQGAAGVDASADSGDASETEALLGDLPAAQDSTDPGSSSTQTQVSLTSLIKDPEIRPGFLVIALTQIGQQLSGVNAVLYYSTGILGSVLKSGGEDAATNAKLIGVGITVVNAVMTFPPIFLVPEHRFGRKNLLLLSSATMMLSSLLLGVSLQSGWSDVISAACIITFVMGFSVGLGPVPFLILPELVPSRAVSHASSIGLALNWVANIILASSFLPLRNAFMSIDGGKGGSIFWIFTIVNSLTFVNVWKLYRYEGEERNGRARNID